MTRKIYDDLLIRSLCAFDIGNLIGNRLAIVDVSPASLALQKLQSLPVSHTILMIDAPEDYQPDLAGLIPLMQGLKAQGFNLGWNLRATDKVWREVLPHCDYLRILTPSFDGLEIANLISAAHKSKTGTSLKVFGAEITTIEDFQLCFRAGGDYFQGAFVNSRQNWLPPKSEVDRVRVMRLLNEFRAGAENEVLADAVMQDPVLTFKILRYVNSAALGFQKEITSVQQALLILGREKFYRWLSLLLFDVLNPGFIERNLIEQALVRARLMEQLAVSAEISKVNSNDLFLTGLFSLLPLMLGRTLEQVLEQITVSENVALALKSQTGPLASFLALAIACEKGDAQEMEIQAKACDVETDVLNREVLLALKWANELSS